MKDGLILLGRAKKLALVAKAVDGVGFYFAGQEVLNNLGACQNGSIGAE